MINRRRFKQIEEIVERILHQTNSYTIPVPVFQVAGELGLQVLKHDFGPDISGVLIQKSGTSTIGYNSENSEKRQRFTVAHEIGHFILGHQREGMFVDNAKKHFSIIFRDNNSSTGEILQEREANAFAAALLMPKPLLLDYINRVNFDLSDGENLILELATSFEVSTQAMAYRLANLGVLNSASI
jgi:Zn-dependent peptidase ImmA (M78 family)